MKKAEIVKGTDLFDNELLQKKLKKHIDSDNLIGFPTETVYGLGGNSLSEKSLLNIFRVKNRPLTDPIISHVYDLNQAFVQLYHINLFEKYLLFLFNFYFWPGPLSVIARGQSTLPSLLSANTGFCAVRIPNNLIAREIIRICDIPVAAPSANKFQHISATNAVHVFEEFSEEPILVFDHGQCDIGIESTVIKILKYQKHKYGSGEEKREVLIDEVYEGEWKEEEEYLQKEADKNGLSRYEYLNRMFENISKNQIDLQKKELVETYVYNQIMKYKELYEYYIVIYRRGKYTNQDIQNALMKHEITKDIVVELSDKIKFEALSRVSTDNKNTIDSIVQNGTKEEEEKEGTQISPGMLLTHYSPLVSTYLIDFIENGEMENSFYNNDTCKNNPILKVQDIVMLDIGGSFKQFENQFCSYLNISFEPLTGKEKIYYIIKNVFLFLREAESVAIRNKAQFIFISIVHLKSTEEISLSLFDRIFRAASGKMTEAFIKDGQLQITSIN